MLTSAILIFLHDILVRYQNASGTWNIMFRPSSLFPMRYCNQTRSAARKIFDYIIYQLRSIIIFHSWDGMKYIFNRTGPKPL